MEGKLKHFLKEETVLCVALLLADCWALLIQREQQYMSYID